MKQHIIQKNIKTERLYIREFEISDAQDIFELDSDKDVLKFIGEPMLVNIEEANARIERTFIYYKKHPGLGVFPAFLNDTNEFIGWIALKYLDESDKIEVGYRLKKKFWGYGYATELTKAMLNYAFEKMKLTEVYAVTHPDNSASQNVLKKSGLKYIGIDVYYNKDVSVFKIERET